MTTSKCTSKQNVMKTYHVAQELREFSLTDHGRVDGRMDSHRGYSADPRVVQYIVKTRHALSLVKLTS